MSITPIQKVFCTVKVHTTGGQDQTSDRRLDARFSHRGTPDARIKPEPLLAIGWSSCRSSAIKFAASRKKVRLPADLAMTVSSHLAMIRLLPAVVLVLAATCWAQTRPPILEKVAKTYGFDSFGQVEAIRYTW